MDQNQVSGAAWIPTQGSARMGLRRALLSNVAGSKNKYKPVHQSLGTLAQIAGGTSLGAFIGAAAGSDRSYSGTFSRALKGAGVGLGTVAGAHLLAALIAAATPKRTLKQQKQYEQSGTQTAANYLIPGAPSYNGWKSIGTMLGDQYQKTRAKQKKAK